MLSIIIPTFNEEKYLPKLLASIKKQDYKDYEIIVSDASSKDRTIAIARRFGCKVIKGGRPAVGRNRGARIAKGQYLLFLDADVILPTRDFFARILYEFEKNNLDAAAGLVSPISDRRSDKALHGFVNFYLCITQYFKPHAPGCCILVKREVHFKINGFNTRLKLNEDHDYAKRAKKVGSFKILRKHVFISVRRLDKEGRITIAYKYFLCELCYFFLGNNLTRLIGYSWAGY